MSICHGMGFFEDTLWQVVSTEIPWQVNSVEAIIDDEPLGGVACPFLRTITAAAA